MKRIYRIKNSFFGNAAPSGVKGGEMVWKSRDDQYKWLNAKQSHGSQTQMKYEGLCCKDQEDRDKILFEIEL